MQLVCTIETGMMAPVWRQPAEESDDLAACVARMAKGDAEALAQVYNRTKSAVYGLALRILRKADEAEEVAADVYTQLWKSAGRYDPQRGSVEAWLVTVARSRAVDRLRARMARPDLGPAVLPVEGIPSARVSEFDELIPRERVERALRTLRPDERELIELAFYDGYTHSELAARLRLPLGTVKTRMRATLLKLRRALTVSESRHAYTVRTGATELSRAV